MSRHGKWWSQYVNSWVSDSRLAQPLLCLINMDHKFRKNVPIRRLWLKYKPFLITKGWCVIKFLIEKHGLCSRRPITWHQFLMVTLLAICKYVYKVKNLKSNKNVFFFRRNYTIHITPISQNYLKHMDFFHLKLM